MNKLFKASVKSNKKLTENHYLITLHPLKKITIPKPGQFFMLSAEKGLDPLLKRPFSIHRWLGQDFQILYRTVGRVTEILKDKKPGKILEVLGPLGNGFPLIKEQTTRPIMVAGGLGIAPVFNLAEAVSPGRRSTAGNEKPVFFFGARTKKELLCVKELMALGIRPVISTDDGSAGEKGLITDAVKKFLAVQAPQIADYRLYACGPKPMLKELSRLAGKYGLSGYVALEENMACGIGACMGCVVNTRDGSKRVCKDGPVFPIEEIVW